MTALPACPAPTPSRSPALPGLCAAVLLAAAPAAWAESNPWYLGASQGFTRLSNVYSVGDQQQLSPTLSKSDTLSTTTLLGGFDEPYARQRFRGSASLRANRYQSNEALNNTGYGLNLGWDWATVERLSGTLSASADRSLAQFNSVNSAGSVETRRNLVNSAQIDAVARLGVVTRYTLEATLGHRQRSYSAPEYDRYRYEQNSGSLGLRYRPSSALSLGAALRLTRGVYPHFSQTSTGSFLDDRFTRRDIDFSADWNPTGHSSLSARLSPTRTSYDRDVQHDFSGLTGSATWAWQPTGKLKLTTRLSRDTGLSADARNLGIFGPGVVDFSRTTNALLLQGDWAASAKINLTAALIHSDRALSNTTFAGGTVLQQIDGKDRTTTLSLGARWTPTRALLVGCDVGANRRDSDGRLTVSMNASTIGCYGQFTLN